MRIFLAAPLFSDAERAFNAAVARQLRDAGFEVWLAQEAPFIIKGTAEEKKAIFEGDLKALANSDVVLAVLDGLDVDSGVAFELGFAHALQKPMFGLKTDYRAFSRIEDVNLMIEAPLKALYRTVGDAIAGLRTIK